MIGTLNTAPDAAHQDIFRNVCAGVDGFVKAYGLFSVLHGKLWDTDSFRLGYAEPPPSEREALVRFAAKRLPLRGSCHLRSK